MLCKNMDMERYELTKELWERVKQILQAQSTRKRGCPLKDDKNMLNGRL